MTELEHTVSEELLRFTAADIYQRADVVVAQVRAALLFKHNPRFQD